MISCRRWGEGEVWTVRGEFLRRKSLDKNVHQQHCSAILSLSHQRALCPAVYWALSCSVRATPPPPHTNLTLSPPILARPPFLAVPARPAVNRSSAGLPDSRGHGRITQNRHLRHNTLNIHTHDTVGTQASAQLLALPVYPPVTRICYINRLHT